MDFQVSPKQKVRPDKGACLVGREVRDRVPAIQRILPCDILGDTVAKQQDIRVAGHIV